MLISLVLAAVAGLPDPPPLEPFRLTHRRAMGTMCYPSGLRVTVVEDTRQPVVSVVTLVDRGAAQDPLGQEGAAHLMEHLWFRAAPDGVPVADRLDDLGAQHNAFTLRETTMYATVADSDALKGLLELEAARLHDPLVGVTSNLIDEERTLVHSELDLRGFVPEDIGRLLPDLRNDPTALRPRNPESIDAIDDAALHAVATDYAPWNTTIQLTGPIRPRAVQELIGETFPDALLYVDANGERPDQGSCPERRSTEVPTPPPDRPDQEPRAIEADVDTPIWLAGYALPPSYGETEPIGRVAALWLEGHLRDTLDRPRFSDVSGACEYVPGADAAAVVCWATLPPGVDGNAVRSLFFDLDQALWSLRRADHRIAEFSRGQQTQVVLSVDTASPLHSDDAMRDAISGHFGLGPDWYNDAIQGYRTLTAESLATFLVEWARPEQATQAVLVRPGQSVDDALAGLTAAQGEDGDVADVVDASPTAGHHPRVREDGEPASVQPSPVRLNAPVARYLDNGLEVIVVPHGNTPIVRTALVAHGGVLTEPQPGLATWAREHASNSPATLRRAVVRRHADSLMSRIWASSTQEASVLGTTGPIDTLDGQLWSLANQVWYAKSLDSALHHQECMDDVRAEVRALDENPAVLASEALRSHVYGPDHPLTPTSARRMLAGGRLFMHKVDKHIQHTYNPANATLVVVGNVDAGAVHTQVERWFGGWRGRKVPGEAESIALIPPPTERMATMVTVEGRDTARFDLGCRVLPASAAITQVGEAWAEERLWAHLRESGVGSYNPALHAYQSGEATTLWMSASVASERTSLAAQAFDAMLADLTQGPSDADVARVARRLQARWPQNYLDTYDVLWATVEDGPQVREVAVSRQDELGQVTADDVRAWAAPCAPGAALRVIGTSADVLEDTGWSGSIMPLTAE